MVAQSYDNIWIYYKDVTNRYNADNRLDFGISKDLVANALKSFGVKLYQNNFSTNDLYSAFLGYGAINPETTNSLPVTAYSGQEYIDNYITASYNASVMPLDDVNKEVYKRLYHNLPYLAKTKGTIPGLRALINCFGIPDTILRISEFGGRDKDTSTYDYFNQKYNYAYYRSGSNLNNHIQTPFRLNSNWNARNNAPESIQFRFKPSDTFPPTEDHQVLLKIGGNSMPPSGSAITLEYNGSGYASASYSGSTYSSSFQYGILTYYPSIDLDSSNETYTNTASLYLPFFNGEWWSVMLNRSGSTYTLFAGSKGYYDGYDGNQILYLNSASVDEPIDNTPFSGSLSTSISFPMNEASIIINLNQHFRFEGYLQELRYWSKTGSAETFKDFVMNPSSIDIDEEENNYANYLAFRAPLGNELDIPVVGTNANTSVHPKVSGSWEVTSSFNNNSSYSYLTSSGVPYSFLPNIESFFYDQPIAGVKNRVTDKMQIISSSYPTGSVLSQYRSLEQTYPTLGSETPDINLLEVAFSPQNEINNDIISSLGYFNIGEYIGDPRDVSSRDVTYPDLVNLSNDFFQKYFASYNLFDYIRLIKYFDNSLFKMLQDFVPARTSLASGVVIKQHLLERNKYPQPQVEWEFEDYSGSVYSQQIWDERITGSYIETSIIEKTLGSTGGTFDSYNFTGSVIPPTFINNTQSWGEEVKTPVGLLTISHSTQDEFYNGELPNSIILTTNGELNPDNEFKYPSDKIIEYKIVQFENDNSSTNTWPIATPESYFLSTTSPSTNGQMFTWFDSGSLTNPGNTRTVIPSRQLVTALGKAGADFFVNKTNGVKWIKIYNIDNNGIDRSDLISQATTISFEFLNGFKTYPIATIQQQSYGYLLGIGPYIPGSMSNFNTGSVNTPVLTSATSGSTIFNPSYVNFDYNDYNVLLDNAETPQTSVFFMDVDYSQNPVIPINQSIILEGNADRAQVQDSNYTSKAWSNIRYNGSKTNSFRTTS